MAITWNEREAVKTPLLSSICWVSSVLVSLYKGST